MVDTEIERRLDRLLRSVAARRPVRQVLMGVERGDGSFRWRGAAGGAGSPDPAVSADTPFFLASIDKLFTATLVMLMAEEGLVDLDAPIAASLPDALVDGLHVLDGTDHTGRITPRHLLAHTSGLPDWLEDAPTRKGKLAEGPATSLVEQILASGDRALGVRDMLAVVRDRLTPHFAPQDRSQARQKARYSNTNYVLLGAIIEQVTGRSLQQVHGERLFRPLNMRHTWFAGRSDPIDRARHAVPLRAHGRPLRLALFLQSIGAIYSTLDDTLAFLRAFVQGRIFARPETMAAMQSRWNRFGLPLDRAALRAPGWPIEYGLGLMRFRLPRLLTPFHPVPAVVGHSGSTGSWLFYAPEADLLLSGSVDDVTAGALPYRVVPRVLTLFR